MKKLILLIAFLFTVQFTQAQKAVVALPAMNIVYIGLDNPVQIAVEGYTNNQLAVGCENCTIIKTSYNYILRATKSGTCRVMVSYKKRRKIKTDTLLFRVKNVPRPETMFGTLESGNCAAPALLSQNSIRAVMPNFSFNGITYTVEKCEILFVPKRGNSEAFSIIGNQIPLELKRLIANSWHGDKILVDDITAVGPAGTGKRLPPIAITIMGQEKKLLEIADFYTYQENNNSKIDTIYDEEGYINYIKTEPFILKGYKTQCGKTTLLLETKRKIKTTYWEKHYYPSGRLKAEYNFENNDTIGSAKNFYENGRLKSEGKLVVKNHSISERYGDQFSYGDGVNDISTQNLLDSFLFTNYSPFGYWKGYYQTGKVAFECTLNIYNCGKIPMYDGESEIYSYGIENQGKKRASIKEAFNNKDSYFKPAFIGSFKLYDHEGKIIKEENFKD